MYLASYAYRQGGEWDVCYYSAGSSMESHVSDRLAIV